MTWRNVDTAMWTNDDWFLDLEPDAKLAFIYLFTNPDTNITGLYRLPSLRLVAFQLGMSDDRLLEIMTMFSDAGKAHYADGWVFVVNMQRRQIGQVSKQLAAHIRKHLDSVPDNAMKRLYLSRYQYPSDSLSIAYPYPIDTLLVGGACPTTKQETRNKKQETETTTQETGLTDFATFADTWYERTARASSSGLGNGTGIDSEQLMAIYDEWYPQLGIERILEGVGIAAINKGARATPAYLNGIYRNMAKASHDGTSSGGALFEVYS